MVGLPRLRVEGRFALPAGRQEEARVPAVLPADVPEPADSAGGGGQEAPAVHLGRAEFAALEVRCRQRSGPRRREGHPPTPLNPWGSRSWSVYESASRGPSRRWSGRGPVRAAVRSARSKCEPGRDSSPGFVLREGLRVGLLAAAGRDRLPEVPGRDDLGALPALDRLSGLRAACECRAEEAGVSRGGQTVRQIFPFLPSNLPGLGPINRTRPAM